MQRWSSWHHPLQQQCMLQAWWQLVLLCVLWSVRTAGCPHCALHQCAADETMQQEGWTIRGCWGFQAPHTTDCMNTAVAVIGTKAVSTGLCIV